MEISLWERLVGEWPLISSAPYTHWLLLLAILVAATVGAHLWNRREMKATKAEGDVKDARIEQLKTEAERLGKELAQKEPAAPTVLPVKFGSDAVQTAFLEIRDGDRSFAFRGSPKDWTKRDISRFAAFTRLQEAGMAEIKRTDTRTVTVTGTAAAALTTEPLTWPRKPPGSTSGS